MVPKNLPLKIVSKQEAIWAEGLSKMKKREYLHSRGYIRQILGELMNIKPLEVELIAPPNQPPKLNLDLKRYISISHCLDCLFFGYSSYPIGLDIERIDRRIYANKIAKRFYSDNEIRFLSKFNSYEYNANTLKFWVAKESAIKWARGSLYKDISNWECNADSNIILNQKDNVEINFSTFQLQNWFLSVASKKKQYSTELVVCLY
tara:strand:+ start:250 stop:864 length:615 start_codon:yes stop_codon:yes gene_type:complete